MRLAQPSLKLTAPPLANGQVRQAGGPSTKSLDFSKMSNSQYVPLTF